MTESKKPVTLSICTGFSPSHTYLVDIYEHVAVQESELLKTIRVSIGQSENRTIDQWAQELVAKTNSLHPLSYQVREDVEWNEIPTPTF